MILFETIKPELFAILTTEPAFSTGVYRDEWASCLKGKKKSLKTVQGRVIISFWKGKALGMPVFAGCVWGCWDHRAPGAAGGRSGGDSAGQGCLLSFTACYGARSVLCCSEGCWVIPISCTSPSVHTPRALMELSLALALQIQNGLSCGSQPLSSLPQSIPSAQPSGAEAAAAVQMCSSCEVWQCLQQCPALSVAVAVPCPFPIPAPSFLLCLLQHFLQLNHGQNGSLVASSPGSSFGLEADSQLCLFHSTRPHTHTR